MVNEYWSELIFFIYIMIGLAVTSSIGYFMKKSFFGAIAANSTLNIRRTVYLEILKKHIGWFDEKDNATGILTNAIT